MLLKTPHIAGMLITLLAITALGFYSGRGVKSAGEFMRGKKAGSWMTAGAIMGTLVGGTSTVGTAQLAFNFGLSAWWFTLGGGLGCLLLALAFVKPLRKTGSMSLSQIVMKSYGQKAGVIASLFTSIGMFINIVSQMLAAAGLLTAFLPISAFWASLIALFLMLVYVLFGGAKSVGLGGF